MKDLMKKEQMRLLTLIRELESSLSQAPKGTFYTVKNGRYTKWYHYINGHEILIPKEDLKSARVLASATFDRIRLREAYEELDAVKAYLRNVGKTDSNNYLIRHPEMRHLLNASPLWSDTVREWANAPYPKSTMKYQGTLYPTLKGDLVKSRAEQMIADMLFLAGIPYRYECAMTLNNGKTYYPDFLIMHPASGDIYIWEHFGMEEIQYYRRKNAGKMYEYFDYGYIPGKNLICTYYSGDKPLTKARVQETIDYYFK